MGRIDNICQRSCHPLTIAYFFKTFCHSDFNFRNITVESPFTMGHSLQDTHNTFHKQRHTREDSWLLFSNVKFNGNFTFFFFFFAGKAHVMSGKYGLLMRFKSDLCSRFCHCYAACNNCVISHHVIWNDRKWWYILCFIKSSSKGLMKIKWQTRSKISWPRISFTIQIDVLCNKNITWPYS